MKLNVFQLNQLFFEIEGKVAVNQLLNERKVEMDGILKAKELSQGSKIEARKKSKEVSELLKLIGEQEKALFEEFVDNFGTSEAKIKEGKDEKEFVKLHEELKKTTHEINKIDDLTVEDIKKVSGTSDYYEILIQLQDGSRDA